MRRVGFIHIFISVFMILQCYFSYDEKLMLPSHYEFGQVVVEEERRNFANFEVGMIKKGDGYRSCINIIEKEVILKLLLFIMGFYIFCRRSWNFLRSIMIRANFLIR